MTIRQLGRKASVLFCVCLWLLASGCGSQASSGAPPAPRQEAPAPKQETDALTGEPESFYVGPGVVTWILPRAAATDGKIKVKWQVCVGEMCYMPGSAELAVPGAAASTAETTSPAENEAGNEDKA